VQVEALMDRLFKSVPDAAASLLGDAGVGRLSAALAAPGGGAFGALCELAAAGDGAAVLAAVDRFRAAAAAVAPVAAPPRAPAAASAAAPAAESPAAPPPLELLPLCDAVWPPAAGAHCLLKGCLARLLLRQAGGPTPGSGCDGRRCWMPVAAAGADARRRAAQGLHGVGGPWGRGPRQQRQKPAWLAAHRPT
jgi:hypothetical protein